MALISIKLPSGWLPIEKTIQILKKTIDLKRFELKENIIVLYFDQVNSLISFSLSNIQIYSLKKKISINKDK